MFDWPADGRLIVPGLKTPLGKASLLVSGAELSTHWEDGSLIVAVPPAAPDRVASVIKLEFNQAPLVEQPLPAQDASGEIALPATLAAIVNSYTGNARVEGSGAAARIAHWQPGITALWDFACTRPGNFIVEAELSAPHPVVFNFGSPAANARSEAMTSADGDFHWVRLGTLSLAQTGEQTLALKSAGGIGARFSFVRSASVPPTRF